MSHLLLLLLAPALLAATPLLLTEVDPALSNLLTNELSKSDKADWDAEPAYDEDSSAKARINRLEEKRSGLRAAMVARGGKGVRYRSGWQVGGDPASFQVEPSKEENFVARRSQPLTSPYLNVGVLSDVAKYFEELRDTLENLADQPAGNSPSHDYREAATRPSATAAYLHALRSHRPSHRVRSFVEDPGPIELRGANSHDPALLWAGLGRR